MVDQLLANARGAQIAAATAEEATYYVVEFYGATWQDNRVNIAPGHFALDRDCGYVYITNNPATAKLFSSRESAEAEIKGFARLNNNSIPESKFKIREIVLTKFKYGR